MAGSRIKGITVEIGGDTTKLQTALKGVNSEIKNTQNQLKKRKQENLNQFCSSSNHSDLSPPVMTGPLQGSTLMKVSLAPRLIKGQCSCNLSKIVKQRKSTL